MMLDATLFKTKVMYFTVATLTLIWWLNQHDLLHTQHIHILCPQQHRCPTALLSGSIARMLCTKLLTQGSRDKQRISALLFHRRIVWYNTT